MLLHPRHPMCLTITCPTRPVASSRRARRRPASGRPRDASCAPRPIGAASSRAGARPPAGGRVGSRTLHAPRRAAPRARARSRAATAHASPASNLAARPARARLDPITSGRAAERTLRQNGSRHGVAPGGASRGSSRPTHAGTAWRDAGVVQSAPGCASRVSRPPRALA